jgi:hypothetical protein
VHGVVSLGAHLTSNEAVTVAAPVPDARNTAVALLPDDLQDTPLRTELLEIVGGQLLHWP